MKVRVLTSLLGIFIAALTGACAILGENVTRNVPLGVAPVITVTPQRVEVLYRDDFNNIHSGWDISEDADSKTAYDDGRYRILVKKLNWTIWSYPGADFADTQIEVDATKEGGDDANHFGVICRLVNDDNYYQFILTSNGYYGIFIREKGTFTQIDADDWRSSAAINQGAATNHIRAICSGSQLTLIINGSDVAQVDDHTFTHGDIGLFAGNYDQPGTDMLFSSLVVYKPE